MKGNLAALIFGVFCALGMSEICVRAAWPKLFAKPAANDRPAYYYACENSDAVDDQGYQVPKPPGMFRIFAIGDSFTFPPYLQFDDGYAERLERMLNLNDRTKTNLKAEVINFGRWGASSLTEVPKTVRAVAEGADLVLLEITLNDPQLTDFTPSNPRLKGKYTFGEFNISKEETPLCYYWRTWGLVASRLHNMRTRESTIRYHRDLFLERETWDNFTKSMIEMQGVCAAAEVPFAAFIFPFVQYEFDEHNPYIETHNKISAFLREHGIPHLDLLPAFSGVDPSRIAVIPGKDWHPNEIAHRIAAEKLYTWLESSHLVPEELLIKRRYKTRVRRVVNGDPRPGKVPAVVASDLANHVREARLGQ